MREQVIGVQRGVESVETDMTFRVDLANPLYHPHAQAQRRVHGDGDPDDTRTGNLVHVQVFDRDIHRLGGKPLPLEERHWHSHSNRLMPEFIARDAQNRAFGAAQHKLGLVGWPRSIKGCPSV